MRTGVPEPKRSKAIGVPSADFTCSIPAVDHTGPTPGQAGPLGIDRLHARMGRMTGAQRDLSFETRAVTGGRPAAEPDAPLNVPLTLTSTYIAGGELEYGRYGNPSWTAFEEVLGDLEGGSCLAFASGMAAIAAVLDLLTTAARVVAPRHSYTGTIAQLRDSEARGRIVVDLVDITDTAAVIAASA